jgi:hypothetical protein
MNHPLDDTRTMDKGLWVWPTNSKGQQQTLKKVAKFPHLIAALQAIVKSKDGLSNSELDEMILDNSNWMTLWTVRQLTALNFIEYKVDLFGGPARYVATPLGRDALAMIIGRPPATKTSVPQTTVQAPPPVQKTS